MKRFVAVVLVLFVAAGTSFAQSGTQPKGDLGNMLRLLLPFAMQGSPQEQYRLGTMFETGNGVNKDEAQAAHWYRKAADAGIADAQYRLGILFFEGRGVSANKDQAIQWFRMAANQGHTQAQAQLTSLVRPQPTQHVAGDRTIKRLRRAALNGDPASQIEMGYRHREGRGLERDNALAAYWFRRAAEQGIGEGQHQLGWHYETGRGVARDLQEAYVWYTLAAKQSVRGASNARDRVGPNLSWKQRQDALRKVDAWRPTTTVSQAQPQPQPAPQVDTRPMIREAQTLLGRLGFDPGPADGIAGSKTRNAIKSYQRIKQMQVTSKVTEELLVKLRSDAGVQAQPQQPQQPRIPRIDYGTYHAVVIGNGNYRSLGDLKTPVSDAHAVASILKQSYGYNVLLLTDASRAKIVGALSEAANKLDGDDRLVVYFAGRGLYDDKGRQSYWLPSDASLTNIANWISLHTVRTLLRRSSVQHALIVADSQFDGQARDNARMVSINTSSARQLGTILGTRVRSALVSGISEPEGIRRRTGSVFTTRFVAALKENQAVMTASELVARMTKRKRTQTQPALIDLKNAGHERGGDFLFVRR